MPRLLKPMLLRLKLGPDVGSYSEELRISSDYDAIGTFQIGTSAISGEGSLSPKDMDLQGFGAHSKIRVENSAVDETFNVRFIDQVFTEHGIVRRQD